MAVWHKPPDVDNNIIMYLVHIGVMFIKRFMIDNQSVV